MTGKRKLKKNKKLQKIVAYKAFDPVSLILDLFTNPPLAGEWYFALFLEKFSIKNKNKINNNNINESWFAEARSSNAIHELYIAVVSVDILKKETVPKSDNVSIATKDNPTAIAGLAEGKIIFKKDFLEDNPRFLPTSIKFWDW